MCRRWQKDLQLRTQARHFQCSLCQQTAWSAEACGGFARQATNPVSPWESKYGPHEVPTTCSSTAQDRSIQGSSYSPVLVPATAWWLSLWLYSMCWIVLSISSSAGSQLGSRVGQGPSKPPRHINCRTKKARISKIGPEHKGLFSRIPVNSVAPSRWSCSEGLTCFQETLKVSQPIIQHEASLRSSCHTCPLDWGQGLRPEGLFPQPFTTFRSKTKTGISVCA